MAELRRRQNDEDDTDDGEEAAPMEVAASEHSTAVDGTTVAAQAAPAPGSGAYSGAEASPAAEKKSGWAPEGFWIRAGGAALIGTIAVVADSDDDDDGAVDPTNRAPAITSNGGGTSAAVNVAENATTVTTVVATDADADPVTYSITGGADASRFAIDGSTGALRFATAPDFESPQDTGSNNVYNVVVTASDGTLSDAQTIAVTVTNVDEEGNEAPIITSNGGGSSAALNVAENTTAVTTVVATDVDEDSTLTYSISGGADREFFTINASSGVLRFIAAPDFENRQDSGTNNTYVVQVTVSDGDLTDMQTITVTVTNVAENAAPQITSNGGGASAMIELAEDETEVTTVVATDADAGDALTYSLGGGADAELFEIDATTGELTFADAPDFEAPADADEDNVYEVIVTVSDGSLSDSQTLSVEITDVDEDNQAPTIDSGGGADTAAVDVVEGDTEVATVLASDPDDDTLDFGIMGGADADLFEIDALTGLLSFLEAPDFDAPADADENNIYEVIVAVTDGSLSDSQTISVTVTETAEAALAMSGFDPAASALFTEPDLIA
ncbi:cadherin domain-containing protein [Panacagrimonas sp.]|uniref:cadherin domain-containing protein n=1 Tax=Panacagrimonas sp. TaxID=2480088 RepID=UPI003B51D1A0